MAIKRPFPIIVIIGVLFSLVSCATPEATPTPDLPIVVPTTAARAVAPTTTPAPPTATTSPTPSLTPSITPTPTPSQIPVGQAVDPSQVSAGQSTNTNNSAANILTGTPELEWRPPPMPVPLAIHPDDHYWLARPLPSGSRNYDLEWYPYGNDVLIPAFAPFRIHHGIDFPNPTGTPVLSAGDGEVVWAGPRPSTRDGINYYGNTIIIKHDWQWQGKDVYTLYAHTVEMFVDVGDRVQTGQLLAGVGGSGVVSGTHLHFEVRVGNNRYFDTRNPNLWLAPYEGWGTLAGRFVDRRGEPISNARIVITPLQTSEPTAVRSQRTYMDRRLQPDEVWQENFVVGDLPAGRYQVEISIPLADDGIIREFQDTVEILPGRTNYLLVQADFVFVPTPTPPATIAPSTEITGTTGITGTVPITITQPEEGE